MGFLDRFYYKFPISNFHVYLSSGSNVDTRRQTDRQTATWQKNKQTLFATLRKRLMRQECSTWSNTFGTSALLLSLYSCLCYSLLFSLQPQRNIYLFIFFAWDMCRSSTVSPACTYIVNCAISHLLYLSRKERDVVLPLLALQREERLVRRLFRRSHFVPHSVCTPFKLSNTS